MMPNYVDPKRDLDSGIRDLVVNVARLPGSVTYTNCEGHENYAPPMLPAKGGWFHFDLPENRYDVLLDRMNDVCSGIRYNRESIFSLKNWDSIEYTLSADFEEVPEFQRSDESYQLTNIGKRDLKNYLRRASNRKPTILRGWSALSDLVKSYIKETITDDIESLPFKDPNDRSIPFRMCGH